MTNAMVLERRSNLIMPSCCKELDKEEMTYVEGGGHLSLTISFSIGGLAKGVLDGFITGFATAFCAKLGASGGVVGSIIGGLIGATMGVLISSSINKAFGRYSTCTITIIDCWIPFLNIAHDIDLGEKIGQLLGGGGGISGGMAAASAFAMGMAEGALA